MVWSVARANGEVVYYETSGMQDDIVSGRRIRVVLTTVTTLDSLGVQKRKLRERYAVSLATATGGTFELPDSSRSGRWLTSSRFELSEILRR
jgi:hypothetical protein